MGRAPGSQPSPAHPAPDDAPAPRGELPEEATGTAALVLHVAKAGHGGTYVDLVGEYRDEYVRTPDGWRFRRRHLVTLEDA